MKFFSDISDIQTLRDVGKVRVDENAFRWQTAFCVEIFLISKFFFFATRMFRNSSVILNLLIFLQYFLPDYKPI
jgi:hypothetical protein